MIDLNFDDLRESFPRLFRTTSKAFEYESGTHAVDITKLNDFTRGELSTWIRMQQEKAQPVVEPAAPVVEKQVVVVVRHEDPDIRDAMSISPDEHYRIEKQAEDEERGLARVEQYAVEQGLERTAANAAAIQQWLNENLKGYMSEQGVDLAIQWLGPKSRNILTWTPKTVEPPAPAEPAEVLAPLPNGEPRLPLDVPPTNKASKEQVKDWLARTREATGKYLRPAGGFGSRF